MASPGERIRAIDVARGLAIIGVVVNHGIDGVVAGGLLSTDSWLVDLNAMLYIFRMPALAVTLGLFIPGGALKWGALTYLRRRSLLMLWVFVLWTMIQGFVQVALSSVTNGDTTVGRVLTFWEPIAQLWFLPAVISMTAAVVLVRPWGSAWAVGRLVLLAVPAVLLWGTAPNIAGVRGFALVLFVGIGAAIGRSLMGRMMQVALWKAALALASSLTIFLILASTLELTPATLARDPSLLTRSVSVLAAAFGVAALFASAALLSRFAVAARILSAVGTQTMPIYLMHILVLAGVRISLSRLDVPGVGILAIAIPLAIAVPYAVGVHAQQLRVQWLFELPKFKRAGGSRL